MNPNSFDTPKSIRITNRGRDQLITIKRRTGLEHWNVISRWALALSLKESTAPPKLDQSGDSNVEMTWEVFGGGRRDLWHAITIQRFSEEPGTHENLAQFLRAHVHRGIQMMAAQGQSEDTVALFSSMSS
jgi:DNA sulfur modification protein DndE